MIITWIKIKLLYFKAILVAIFKHEKIKISKSKQAYIMLAANYNNLGDIAITYAQEQFLKQHLPLDYEVIVIPYDKTFKVYFSLKKLINHDTIITLIGGGNSGTLYEFIEYPRRFILKHFKNTKIISFPQSVYYDANKTGSLYKKEFVKLCLKCKDLTLIARESLSYDRYIEMFGNSGNILLVPDIVFSIRVEDNYKRHGLSIIMRNDKEKDVDEKTVISEINKLKEKYDIFSYNDTCDVNVVGNGYEELRKYIDNLKTKQFVITDRLHGMILSYITNTPCLVFDNKNHKIRSTFETWLLNQTLVKMYNYDDCIYYSDRVCRVSLDENYQQLIDLLEVKYGR